MMQQRIINTLAENMELLCKRRNICDEQRLLTLEQFIEISCSQLQGDAVANINLIYQTANKFGGKLSCKEKIFVCKLISANTNAQYDIAQKLSETAEDIGEDVRGRIAYVKNTQNDSAFLAFSQQLKNARAFYAPTFSDCCEAVVDNKCEFCILPIENADGGKLYSFYSLIDKYELKICTTARCVTDDEQDVVYALVSKSISPAVITAPHMRFEFTTVGEQGDHIGEVIKALQHLSCNIYSLNTRPIEYDYQKQKCIFSVDVPDNSLAPLLIYLENEYPRYTPIGLYKIDKENLNENYYL